MATYDDHKAQKIVELEARVKAAAMELEAISKDLEFLDMDIKISGWDWNIPGSQTEISTQGRVVVTLVNTSERIKR